VYFLFLIQLNNSPLSLVFFFSNTHYYSYVYSIQYIALPPHRQSTGHHSHSDSDDHDAVDGGIVAGAVIGALVGVALVGSIVYLLYTKKLKVPAFFEKLVRSSEYTYHDDEDYNNKGSSYKYKFSNSFTKDGNKPLLDLGE
jgi:hypothetical protein